MRISNAKGFTLIELVVVIVILGILATTALATFVNLQRDARIAATQGSLGTNRAVASMSYARKAVDNEPGFTSIEDMQNNDCGSAANPYNCWQTNGAPVNTLTGGNIIAADPFPPLTVCSCDGNLDGADWYYNGGPTGTGRWFMGTDNCDDTDPCNM